MKRKFLSLLLSAAMLLTLVTPAFAAGERSAEESEEAVLLGGGTAIVGGGGMAIGFTGGYDIDERGVATFTLYEGFRAAMNDENVTAVLIEENHHVTFGGLDELIEITKPLIIDGTLRIENAYVMATADVTVNGRLEVFGDFDGHYTEWRMDAPERYWDDFTEAPDTLDGPKLINNGTIEMSGLSGVMLSWPCDYAGEGELYGGEFKYADYLNYYSHDEDDGLTVRYTEEQMTIRYMDGALRTAFVNTEKGLLAALADESYNIGIQVYGDGVALRTAGEYTAPCSLLTNAPFTVGEGVTLNLAPGTFNQFNNGLTVAGTLNFNTEGNMAFVNGGMTVAEGGRLNNAPGSNLNINGGYTSIAGTLENLGSLNVFANEEQDCMEVSGEVVNHGRMENHSRLLLRAGGLLDEPDSGEEIRYWDNREEAWDHALFNHDFIRVDEGAAFSVGGYLQNNGCVRVSGEMRVNATAQDNNKSPETDGYGVLNGAVQSWGELIVDGGALHIEAACEEAPARPFGGAVVSHGPLRIENEGQVFADGQLWLVGEVMMNNNGINKEHPNLEIGGVCYGFGWFDLENGLVTLNGTMELEDGELCVGHGKLRTEPGSELYIRNNARLSVFEGGIVAQRGYVQSDNEIRLDGGSYTIKPAETDNTSDNCVGQNSVLCSNNYLGVFNGGLLDVNAGEDGSYSGVIHNNGRIDTDGGKRGGTLLLGGVLRNFGDVENRGVLTVVRSGLIDNHGHLLVGDSATFGGDGFGRIDWQEDASAETNLKDELVYRIWEVNGPEHRRMNENYDNLKDSEYWGNIVMRGQDYFGGWVDARQLQREGEIGSFRVVSDDERVVSVGADNGRFDTFSLYYHDWGETALRIEVDGETVRRYDARTTLSFFGFYTDRALTGDGQLDWEEAKHHCAVTGGGYCYNLGDQLWLMRCDGGFDRGEIFGEEDHLALDRFELNLWRRDGVGGRADISERDENGWYHVSLFGEEYMMLRPEERPGSWGRYDLLVEFTGGEESYDIDWNICGAGVYFNFFKPAVYVADAAGVAGEEVTVAVGAEAVPTLIGYQLRLRFDPGKLNAERVLVNGEYAAVTDIDNDAGTVCVAVAAEERNQIGDGELFYVTFTVDGSAGACEDIAVCFDERFEQSLVTLRRGEETELAAARRGGNVSTFLAGDVHRDGRVNILDAVRLLRAAAELVELSPAEREAARVTEENAILISGVLPILNHIVKGTALTYYPAQ